MTIISERLTKHKKETFYKCDKNIIKNLNQFEKSTSIVVLEGIYDKLNRNW